MSEKNMKVRMRQVFTDEEMRRISVNVTDGRATVIADVHGMGCLQARVFISNVIALFRGAFNLIVVHGFNHGTALRDMIRRNPFEEISSKINSVRSLPWNDGVTQMDIRALCAA